jgi:secreted trypsin-like serine protease
MKHIIPIASMLTLTACLTACSSDQDSGRARAGGEDSLPAGEQSQDIIGGRAASNQTFPWSVRILYNGAFKCGGSLISPDWVLTVAHCLTLAETGYSVELGSGEVIGESAVLRHPSYVDDQAVTGHFDMGLIRLARPAVAGTTVGLGTTVGFIRPAIDGDAVGTTAVAIGWGMTNHDYTQPALPTGLRQVSLPVVSNSSCNNVLPVRRVIYSDELCAGFADGSKGVCFGDSGSALMVQRASGTWEHIGTPAGVATIDGLIPLGCFSYAVFARTSAMLGWVRGYAPDPAWFPVLNLVAL